MGNSNLQIDRLDAAGGVVVHSPSETAKGDFGVYDLNRKLITLIGNVQLTRENQHRERVAAGDRPRLPAARWSTAAPRA